MVRVDEGAMDDADIIAAQGFADVTTIGILQHRAAIEAQRLNTQLTFALTAASSSSRPKVCWASGPALTWSKRSHD